VRFTTIQSIMGLLLVLFSIIMLPSLGLALLRHEPTVMAFLLTQAIALGVGLLMWLPARKSPGELRVREGFLVVVLAWALLASFGALPFLLAGTTSGVADAYFEAMAGLTTTGSSVLSQLDELPLSINLWRAVMQFLGGMGIVLMAIAVLPLLGVGGMQLYKAETPGPMKDNKLTPRIRETARGLWYIYLGLITTCALSLWFAGMAPFDAIMHSFTTVSTGGFSNHDASIAYYHSPLIEAIVTLFMFLGGTNFALHFAALRERDPRAYWQDAEFRAYFMILVAAVVIVAVVLLLSGTYAQPLAALRFALFQVVSMATTTGFVSADFALWVPVTGALLMALSFFAGSAGSTAGGIKVVRIMVLYKRLLCEIQQLIHPHSVVPLKVAGKGLADRTAGAITMFFIAYMSLYALLALLVTASGVDLVTAFSATAAALNNTGPGLGNVEPAVNFASLPQSAKWVLSMAMLAGRLELFTLLVLFTRSYWRT
jgi:trk/ktr system potassium uptake protein